MSPQVLSKEGPEKRVARASPADSPPSKKRAASQGESASTMEKNYKDLSDLHTNFDWTITDWEQFSMQYSRLTASTIAR